MNRKDQKFGFSLPRLAMFLPVAIAVILMTGSLCLGLEHVVSDDFDLIEGNAGGMHNIRIYPLTQGATSVRIQGSGATAVEASVSSDDQFAEWTVTAGSKIVSDKPVAAFKYNAAGSPWSTVRVGTGRSFAMGGALYYMVAAAYDATEISADTNGDGIPESINLNAGYVALLSGVQGTSITSSKDVTLFATDGVAGQLQGIFLLVPGSSSYVPLYPLAPNGPTYDEQASAGSALKMLGKAARLAERVLTFVMTLGDNDACAAATSETNVNNGNGTYTFTQIVDESSSAPHYTRPSNGGGFQIYSWFNQNYGWKHTFPYSNSPGMRILSSTLTVRAYDVDAEPTRGYNGEYDGITGDGSWLNPQYLQGTNGTWSVTNFNVDPSALYDGNLDVFCDIDMHHTYRYWATTLDYSKISIVYSYTSNNPPYSPTLSISPTGCTFTDDPLVVTVTGPIPADPNGNPVVYEYRWLVDVGTGNYIDDEFAGRGNHTGNTVPASDTQNGDKWKVEVTPIDSLGARGTKNSVSFATIGQCNTPPISDAGPDRQVSVDVSTTLDGSASNDPDGSITSYKWELYSAGSWTNIGNTASVNRTFAIVGTYTLRLTVTDNYGASDDDLVYVTVVPNRPPTANAGQDRTVNCIGSSTSVTLDGSGSSDPDGDQLTYSWSGPFGTASGVKPSVVLGLGSHTVTLTVDDGHGHTTTDPVVISVVDNVPPSLEAGQDVTLEATSPAGASYQIAPVVNDNCCNVAVSITPQLTLYPIGQTVVTVKATDCSGNEATDSVKITVVDTTPPVLSGLNDQTLEATSVDGVQATFSVTATDIADPAPVVACSPASGSMFPLGATTVTCTATDAGGNPATGSFTITVTDTTPPVLTVPPDVTAEATGSLTPVPIGVAQGTDIFPVTISNDAQAAYPVGITLVHWTAKDANGNISTGIQKVTIVDTTAPVVTPPPNLTVEATGPLTPVNIGMATATDLVGVVSLTNDAPASFPLGTTTITWTARDAAGNIGTVKQTVTVVDSTPPQLKGLANQILEAISANGAPATFSVTATDIVDSAPVVACSAASGSTFQLGVTTVNCTATDASGNSSAGSFTITVQDTTPPALVVPSSISVLLNTPLSAQNVQAFLNGAQGSDIVDSNVTVTVNPPALDSVGAKTVTFIAVDDYGNKTTVTSTIYVTYGFGGFLTPVSLLKPFKLGSTVPVKFQLADYTGNTVTSATARFYLQKYNNNEPVGEPIEVTSTSGADTGNYFRLADGMYMYNLATNGLSIGTYQIQAALDDGTMKTIWFEVK